MGAHPEIGLDRQRRVGMQSWHGVQGAGKSMSCVGPGGATLNCTGAAEGGISFAFLISLEDLKRSVA